jgi:hypothetical protein
MTDADQFMPPAAQDKRTAQDETDREGAGAGTSSPSDGASNDIYTHESDKCNDRAEPCGWREMYRAMGAVLPCHE